MTGTFLNFYLPFSQHGKTVTPEEQAGTILSKAEELLNNGHAGVAITYSANHDQTEKIEEVYAAGGWRVYINGANQASVMREMETLLENAYPGLRGKMHIAPITTMNGYSHRVQPWNEEVHTRIVSADLNRIESYLQKGWCVLGWQNQITVHDSKHPYAVGGGVTTLPGRVDKLIQKTLLEFAEKYKKPDVRS